MQLPWKSAAADSPLGPNHFQLRGFFFSSLYFVHRQTFSAILRLKVGSFSELPDGKEARKLLQSEQERSMLALASLGVAHSDVAQGRVDKSSCRASFAKVSAHLEEADARLTDALDGRGE